MSFASYKGMFLVGLAASRPTYPANDATLSADGTIVDVGMPVFYFATDTGVISVYQTTLTSTVSAGQIEGTWTALGGYNVTVSTFAGLPASPFEGQLAFVTDGDSASYANGAAIAGAGTTKLLAVYNGTAWVAA